MKTFQTLFLLVAYLAVAGCGQIGPLYLPAKEEAPSPSDKETPNKATPGQH